MARDFVGADGSVIARDAGRGSRLSWLSVTPSWALSAAIHLILVLVLLSIVMEAKAPVQDTGGTVVHIAALGVPNADRPAYDRRKPRDTEARPQLPVPFADTRFVDPHRDEDEITTTPLGDDPANLGGRSHIFSRNSAEADVWKIGVGGGVEARNGVPWGEDRAPARRIGSPGPSEDAVRAALEWLRRHQGADGAWHARDFVDRCAGRCRNADPARREDGRGLAGHDVGVTGLALLAFTGWGQTHHSQDFPEYRDCVRRAMLYLKSVQDHSGDPGAHGRFGPATSEQWVYDHAIATLAMCELYLMTDDVTLKNCVADAVRLCLRAQNSGFGWRYGIQPGDNDTSVTGWMLLALKTARSARIGIPQADLDQSLAGALTWIGRATSVNGRTGYQAPGDEGSRLANQFPDPYPYSKELSSMTAVGVLCRLFAGESRVSLPVRRGSRILSEHLPTWEVERRGSLSRINFYYWYYGSYALFQLGGAEWNRWNEAMLGTLLKSQRQGETLCEDGSWDPIDEWGPVGGRVYATSMGAMTLEVYYRFRRIEEGEKRAGAAASFKAPR